MSDSAPVARVVLDTNVCLDLFVFDDPRCAPLRESLRAGRLAAVTRADCRAEWLAVLAYPRLALDAARQVRARQAFDGVVRCLPVQEPAARPPRCADPDDQKFLDLAAACGARMLFSRDAALLRLARRTARAGLFAILPPWEWRETP